METIINLETVENIGLSFFDITEEYVNLSLALHSYIRHNYEDKEGGFSDKEIDTMLYKAFRYILLEKGHYFSEDYRDSILDTMLLFYDKVLDALSE